MPQPENLPTDNGGSGFGPWSLSEPGAADAFVFTSTSNGDGDGNSDGDIDSPSNGRAWGLASSNTTDVAEALRSLPAGGLLVGQTFHIDLDIGFLSAGEGRAVGLAFRNSSGNTLFEFLFRAGQSFFEVNDADPDTLGDGFPDTSIGFTDEGLSLEFSLVNGSGDYSLDIATLDPVTTDTHTGSLISPNVGDQTITELRLFSFNAGNAAQHNVYFNNLQITAVPEASAFLCGSLICCVAGLRRSRRPA